MGWKVVSRDWGNAIISYILASLVIGALSGTVIGLFFTGPFVVGMYFYFLKAVRNEEMSVDTLFIPVKIDFQRTMILFLLKEKFPLNWNRKSPNLRVRSAVISNPRLSTTPRLP